MSDTFVTQFKAAPLWQRAFITTVFIGGAIGLGFEAIAYFSGEKPKENVFTLVAEPGTDMEPATEKFRALVGHCPGINKYKADIAKVEYLPSGHADFLVTVSDKPEVIPAEAYAVGHTCHFSVTAEKATVGKRPCSWLCTGEDMTGVDGNDHSYATGQIIGPLQRPWANLREAVASTMLDMADIHGIGVSKGAALLAIWGSDHMKWSELQAVPSSKYGMVMKEPDSQRGKRLCATGHVIEIAKDSSVPQQIYLGGLSDEDGKIYRYIAVGSTGEIVADSRARFCGVVTGQQHYPNSVGGEAHAVHLVGMFDLPENKSQ